MCLQSVLIDPCNETSHLQAVRCFSNTSHVLIFATLSRMTIPAFPKAMLHGRNSSYADLCSYVKPCRVLLMEFLLFSNGIDWLRMKELKQEHNLSGVRVFPKFERRAKTMCWSHLNAFDGIRWVYMWFRRQRRQFWRRCACCFFWNPRLSGLHSWLARIWVTNDLKLDSRGTYSDCDYDRVFTCLYDRGTRFTKNWQNWRTATVWVCVRLCACVSVHVSGTKVAIVIALSALFSNLQIEISVGVQTV